MNATEIDYTDHSFILTETKTLNKFEMEVTGEFYNNGH